jgi:hypothetical protein
VGDRFLVHVDDGLNDVSQVLYCLSETEGAHLVEVVEESASVEVLHHQVDVRPLLEAAVETDYVWVLQTAVQTNFAAELLNHFKLSHSGLDYLLEGNHESSLPVSAQKDLPELPLAQHHPHLEPVHDSRPLPGPATLLLDHLLLGLALHNFVEGFKGLLLPRVGGALADV